MARAIDRPAGRYEELAALAEHLAISGMLSAAVSCAEAIDNRQHRDLAYRQVSTEMSAQGQPGMALDLAARIHDEQLRQMAERHAHLAAQNLARAKTSSGTAWRQVITPADPPQEADKRAIAELREILLASEVGYEVNLAQAELRGLTSWTETQLVNPSSDTNLLSEYEHMPRPDVLNSLSVLATAIGQLESATSVLELVKSVDATSRWWH